jgi:hypothetical protein
MCGMSDPVPSLPSIVNDPDLARRTERLRAVNRATGAREFVKRREGMIHAMDGGVWLHRHVWLGRPMVHLVSTDRDRLLAYGRALGIPLDRLQYKPLRDPRTDVRREAWHWDLGGPVYPPLDDALRADDARGEPSTD